MGENFRARSLRRAASDVHIPACLNILARVLDTPRPLIEAAPNELDWHEATDAVSASWRASIKTRSSKCIRFRHELCMRQRTDKDIDEFRKIKSGFCDYYLSTFLDEGEQIHFWHVVDLKVFRQAMKPWADPNIFTTRHDEDEDVHFISFDLTKISAAKYPDLIVASNFDISR